MVNGKHNKLKHARIRIEVRERVSSQDIIRDISMRVWVWVWFWVLAAPVTVTASESQRNPKQRNRNSGQRDIRFLFLVWLASWLPSWLPGCPAAWQDILGGAGRTFTALKPFHSIGQKKC